MQLYFAPLYYQAAEMTGFSKHTFAELLSSYGVSIFNVPAAELSKDVENA